MIIYRLKSEYVAYDLYLPEKSNGKTVLYVPGLPGHPRKRTLGESFASKGFAFIEMRYIGTWESDGVFTMENCLKSLDEAYSFARGGSGTELRRGVKKVWSSENVIFMGSSFGGGVILSSHIKDPLTFVLLAVQIILSGIITSSELSRTHKTVFSPEIVKTPVAKSLLVNGTTVIEILPVPVPA